MLTLLLPYDSSFLKILNPFHKKLFSGTNDGTNTLWTSKKAFKQRLFLMY
ncbi:hypothetical protein STRPS_0696 [Streptococcus pseudoporcinus LQ 940-04]|uniref:Uncharacterized protein n=1 Tax=Streptococcus pseudoporcinus LQ 940-04 TaxID=875093 RepID=G5KAA3_9STRE|nr:hypothetical protein HMPREF9320_1300 [Streptococcus pseudoporcinus SPIN 20026]EHI65067.1 hypothetical protein STRPS_0696 [Streptococcus pseudoporcinus LQ 940-04]